ncbi:proline iminopeptidase-family hydrolase [Psychroflexus sp. YR1-1]|uniref:Proline iminopeptidase-family hydrolase n=1 Tax=Psychroflexus aurantiacus TaxID=2709310 RepID=A0A6B3R4F0_9FLAO|nr:proline iminopeptidase-family hydrolase [Psychroflexus aurantiacus]NEV92761.1 proline iminopeptidase-family hydrolase [Psychroflexus aurantiacus]
MKTQVLSLICLCFLALSCTDKNSQSAETEIEENVAASSYFDYSDSDDQWTGGVRMIPIETPKGTFKVYTKRMGNNPKMRILLLHGGPGGTHEQFGNFEGYLPNEEIEYIYYDQLDSYYSDKPNDPSLWTTERFVEEVEQVRQALGLHKDNFYLLGQSWGGILALEYALKYQDNLKGLIISNMVASVPEYNTYAQEVLGPQLPEEILTEIQQIEADKDYANPRYEELLMTHFYTEHILRMPLENWPKSIQLLFEHLNPEIYVYMQGPSEFGIIEEATLSDWDVSHRLKEIKTPTLMLGAKHDTMDPKYMEWMATEVQHGRSVITNGSHASQFDDPDTYFDGIIRFVKDVDNGSF